MAGHHSSIAGRGHRPAARSPQEKAAQTTRRAADTLPPDKVGLT